MAADKMKIKAELACFMCKTRKKKCDKALPCCGYCARKELKCQYQDSRLDAAKRYVHLDRLNHVAKASIFLMDTLSSVDLSSHIPVDELSEMKSMDASVSAQVHRIIHATGRFINDLVEQFFSGIYRFVLGVSRNRIHGMIAGIPVITPPANHSILLLAICLISYHPKSIGKSLPGIDQESLYIATKSLFSQVQAAGSVRGQPSISLIQACILIAVYEYARGMADSAFLSIGICARMGYAAGIHERTSRPGKETLSEEERNTWWAILIYERLICCEMTTSQDQPFATAMPGPNAILPTESDRIDLVDDLEFKSATLGSLNMEESIGPQGRSAQGVWILDQVLQTIRMEQTKCKLARLIELNDMLRSFMMTIMRQLHGSHELLCGTIAVVIRTLFLLNEKIIAEQPKSTLEIDSWWRERIEQSQAALSTATKMMVDIVNCDPRASPPEAWPPSRLYRLRAALRYLKNQPNSQKDCCFEGAEARLRDALDQVCWYWSVKKENSQERVIEDSSSGPLRAISM